MSAAGGTDRDEFEQLIRPIYEKIRALGGAQAVHVFMDVVEAVTDGPITVEQGAAHLQAILRGEWTEVAEQLAGEQS